MDWCDNIVLFHYNYGRRRRTVTNWTSIENKTAKV